MSPQSSPKSMTKNVLPRLRSDAAGIDVGATELYVAVPPDRMDKPVRCFGTFTEDLEALAGWLTSHSIRTVFMSSICKNRSRK